jgi:micrococcal nuclease
VSVLGVRSSRRATISGGALVLVTMLAVGAMACGGDQASSSSQASADVTTSTTASPPSSTTSEPLAITTTTGATPAPEPVAGTPAIVESITDGDTFRTTGGERVRLIGIDTPEVDDDACFAAEATAALAALIPPGTEVRLVADVDPFDRFGRVLAYVERASDGLFVNFELALGGFAVQLTVPPNVARADELGAAVADARDAGRGLWGGCSSPTTAAAAPTTWPLPVPQPVPQPSPGGSCDPSYPDVCIPPAPPDLDCPDVPHRRFRVVGADPHGFDGDRDGIGCESS